MLMEVAASDLTVCCVIHQPMFFSTSTLTSSNLVLSEFRLVIATQVFFFLGYNLNLLLVRKHLNIGSVMDLVA